jgi:hypothetical protein
MARRGNPYDDAYVASFLKTLMAEEAYLWKSLSFEQANERIERLIRDMHKGKPAARDAAVLPSLLPTPMPPADAPREPRSRTIRPVLAAPTFNGGVAAALGV